MKEQLQSKWELVGKVLGMQIDSQSGIMDEQNFSYELRGATASALKRMNKERLLGSLPGLGAPKSSSATKTFFISKLLKIRDNLLASETVSGTASAPDSGMWDMPESGEVPLNEEGEEQTVQTGTEKGAIGVVARGVGERRVEGNGMGPADLLLKREELLKKRPLQNPLTSWVLKPLVATSGMKEGSRSELQVIQALPGFFRGIKVMNCCGGLHQRS